MVRSLHMFVLVQMLLLSIFCLPSLVAQENGEQLAEEPEFVIPENEKPFWDNAQKFLDAYSARDAAAIGDLFTEDAEFLNEFGVRTNGRNAIVALFQNVFNEYPQAAMESIDIAEVRHLGDSVVLENGFVISSESKESPRYSSKYAAIHKKSDDGVWRIDVLKDFPRQEIGRQDQLSQLAWMLGRWMNEDSDSVVRSECQYSDDGNYLLRRFKIETEDGRELSGVQRVGWDPIHKKLRSWTFDSEGGFLTGLWTRTENGWLLSNNGVSAEGKVVSATAFYQIIDSEMITWRYQNLIVGDEIVSDSDPVTMVRQPPEPSSGAPTVSAR